jgi:hypothetical protein
VVASKTHRTIAVEIAMSENPYAAPPTDGMETVVVHEPRDTSLLGIARPTFIAWEKLRIAYIAVLGLLTVLLAGGDLFRLQMIEMIIVGAVISNLCYFAGPLAETYVRWLGLRTIWVRVFLFAAGLLFSMLLLVAAMATTMLPDQA